jgi:hydroxymethylpyrimidine pyrophosphatase-like HAD family hydrolase
VNISALALDYDGTIARGDALDPAVRDAIAEARAAGITVLLVTGRILDELRRVAGDLHFVDVVVAENGAVVYFPHSDHLTLLAPPVPTALADELQRRGVPHLKGRCLIDGSADDAARILGAIRDLETPHVLIFNRSRVMTLAQGVSKATGLRAALEMLRLSPRNTVAIGDAENDHELLRLAEIGVAVEWGSGSLQAAADDVLAGVGPPAVAAYISNLARTRRLPAPVRPRRRLLLGYSEDGREFSLAVRGRNVLIAGDAKSGKSWVAGLLCEQLILHGYCVCVIDPEGDYRSLEALPGVSILGGEDPPPTPRELLRALRYPDRSVVIDLARVPHDLKIDYIRSVLPALNVMRRRTGLPHRILVDEAHYFLHDAAAHHLLDLERNGYTVVTYCASKLPAELLAGTEVMIVTCESNPAEVEALRQRCNTCQDVSPRAWSQLCHLPVGQAVALPITDESGGQLRHFTIGRRLTPHVRHRQKYVDVPVTDGRAFVFTANGRPAKRARTLRQFVDAVEHADIRTADGYLRRGDFSRWIGDVFGDHALAHDLRLQEQRYVGGEDRDTLPEIAAAVRSRYDLTDEEAA